MEHDTEGHQFGVYIYVGLIAVAMVCVKDGHSVLYNESNFIIMRGHPPY